MEWGKGRGKKARLTSLLSRHLPSLLTLTPLPFSPLTLSRSKAVSRCACHRTPNEFFSGLLEQPIEPATHVEQNRDCLQHADEEANHCAEEFDRFQVLTGY